MKKFFIFFVAIFILWAPACAQSSSSVNPAAFDLLNKLVKNAESKMTVCRISQEHLALSNRHLRQAILSFQKGDPLDTLTIAFNRAALDNLVYKLSLNECYKASSDVYRLTEAIRESSENKYESCKPADDAEATIERIDEELQSYVFPDLPYNLKRALQLLEENRPPPKITDKRFKVYEA